MPTIAFNTANLVARETDWSFQMSDWMKQDKLTRENTTDEVWREICEKAAGAGFNALEVWSAHVAPEKMSKDRADFMRGVANGHGLQLIGIAGGPSEELAKVANWLGIEHLNGGFKDPAEATRICEAHNLRANFENHPEKTPAEVLAKIDGGSDVLGVALDTGWCGTQGASAAEFVRELGELIRHVHIKDVKEAGTHDCQPLGEGVVDLDETFEALKEIGYEGTFAWEDEPFARNPWLIAEESRQWIEERV